MKKYLTKVAIIGAGPVGLFTSRLFQKFNIPYLILEKKQTLKTHPSANYINMRSMQIFSQIPNLADQILNNVQDLNNYLYFRYVKHVTGDRNKQLLEEIDHLYPSKQARMQKLKQISWYFPVHIPQGKLIQILSKNIKSLLEYKLMTYYFVIITQFYQIIKKIFKFKQNMLLIVKAIKVKSDKKLKLK